MNYRFAASILVLSLGWTALLFSMFADVLLSQAMWFNRSGAILVACSAVLEVLQLPYKENHSGKVRVNGQPVALMAIVPRSVRAFDRVAWTGIAGGTLVWGYGDLVISIF